MEAALVGRYDVGEHVYGWARHRRARESSVRAKSDVSRVRNQSHRVRKRQRIPGATAPIDRREVAIIALVTAGILDLCAACVYLVLR